MATELPSLDRLIDNYLLCCTAEGKSSKTIEWYRSNLKRFSQFLEREHLDRSVADIGPPQARTFILHLQNDVRRWETSPFINDTKGLSPRTIHGYARAIKAFWSWLLDEGYIPENSMARLKCPKRHAKSSPPSAQTRYSDSWVRLIPGLQMASGTMPSFSYSSIPASGYLSLSTCAWRTSILANPAFWLRARGTRKGLSPLRARCVELCGDTSALSDQTPTPHRCASSSCHARAFH